MRTCHTTPFTHTSRTHHLPRGTPLSPRLAPRTRRTRGRQRIDACLRHSFSHEPCFASQHNRPPPLPSLPSRPSPQSQSNNPTLPVAISHSVCGFTVGQPLDTPAGFDTSQCQNATLAPSVCFCHPDNDPLLCGVLGSEAGGDYPPAGQSPDPGLPPMQVQYTSELCVERDGGGEGGGLDATPSPHAAGTRREATGCAR
jgi:hypothetical protein